MSVGRRLDLQPPLAWNFLILRPMSNENLVRWLDTDQNNSGKSAYAAGMLTRLTTFTESKHADLVRMARLIA